MVADVGLELLPGTMIPAYREVVVTVPRQNGKTTLVLSWEIQRAVGWGVRQAIAYTMQTGKDARTKLLKDQVPVITAKEAPVRMAIDRVLRGAGDTEIKFKNGSRIFPVNTSEDSGHGLILDLAVIDESWADEDDRREQSLLPAMLTKPSAQILNISTAGTEKSVFLKRKVDAGRAAVADGVTEGICYFEWSAEEGSDPDDPATWYSCMPALGYTITEQSVRHMQSTMSPGDWLRAGLNQWTVSEERVIPLAKWEAVCSADAKPDGKIAFALDVNPERSAAALAVADPKGTIEIVQHAPGVGWVVDDVAEKAKQWSAPVVIDTYGPAASFIADLESAGVTVVGYATADVAKACATFYDSIADGKVAIRRSAALDLAAAAVRRRQTGDVWLWGRRSSEEDVSPMIAATLAFDHARTRGKEVDLWVVRA